MCYTSGMFSDCRILLLCLPWTAAALTFTTVCELDRPDEPTSLSSLSFVSNGVYWSSTDWKPALHEIVLRQDATSSAQLAAFELNHHIRLITGTELPVVRSASGKAGTVVELGTEQRPFEEEYACVSVKPGKIRI